MTLTVEKLRALLATLPGDAVVSSAGASVEVVAVYEDSVVFDDNDEAHKEACRVWHVYDLPGERETPDSLKPVRAH